tara:strand:- start:4905 stop:5366 length:462 start_codon:yes stop_codon:yes gene_type:complete
MHQITIISVGRIKNLSIQKVEETILKRCSSIRIELIETKAYGSDFEKESEEILKKLKDLSKKSSIYPVLLTENGTLRDSNEFSKWIYETLDKKSEKLTFIISGAYGFSKKLIEKSKSKLSLSPLTFPHEWARLLLIEQIYRSMTIKTNHPYHK